MRHRPSHKGLRPGWGAGYARAVKVASWNVNSIRAREQAVVQWVRLNQPDVLCLQETKVTDDEFPSEELQRMGYAVAAWGQPAYNGVAIVTRQPLSAVTLGLSDEGADAERRAIAATVGSIRVLNVYVPNGKGVDTPAFGDKLAWLERLRRTLEEREKVHARLLVCGDFNVAREDRDVYDPEAFREKLHCHPAERRAFQQLLDQGLCDAFRHFHARPGLYSWWDYRGGGFRKNQGLRIDYVLVTRPLLDVCHEVRIDLEPRRADKPSDHAPVVVDFD